MQVCKYLSNTKIFPHLENEKHYRSHHAFELTTIPLILKMTIIKRFKAS